MLLKNKHDLLKRYYTHKMVGLFSKAYYLLKNEKSQSILNIMNRQSLQLFKSKKHLFSGQTSLVNLAVSIYKNMLLINHHGVLKKIVMKRFSMLFSDKYIQIK
jgi:hypothetical protein